MTFQKLLFCCLPVLCSLCLQAQSSPDFLLQVGSPDSSEYTSAIWPDDHEDLYVAAIVFHKIRRSQHLKLYKINRAGKVLWSRDYPGYERSIFSICKQSDGTLMLAGGLQDSLGNWPATGSALLMKVDQVGNPIWEKTFKFSDRGSIYEMFPTADGYLLTGTGYGEALNGSGQHFFLYKTDLEGTVRWKKEFLMNERGSNFVIAPLKNGNFSCVEENQPAPTRLFTLTPSGDVLHEIKTAATGITSVAEKEDGELIYFQTETIKQDTGRAQVNIYAKILRGDSLITLKQLTNGRLSCAPSLVDDQFYASYGLKNKLTIVKLTPDLETAAEAAIDLPEYTTTDGFLITGQKSLIIVGIRAIPRSSIDATAKSQHNYDMLLKKVSLNSLFKK